MINYKISKKKAKDLQEWALVQSGAKELLGSLKEVSKKVNIKSGLYVDYEIDNDELDGGIDWPDIGIATIYAVLDDGEKIHMGEIRAYNWETFWLSTQKFDEVDNAKNWFELIKGDYEKLVKLEEDKKEETSFKVTKEESEAIYKIVKEYEQNAPESDEDYYDNNYGEYESPIKNKIIKSILKKIKTTLPKEQTDKINKEFLREKYHSFNNEIDEKVYSTIEKAFNQLKTIEIRYFNMESAEFSKREIDVYYKSRKYVIGYCHLRKDIRKFRTSRIASAKLASDSYKIPESFDKNKY